MGLQKKIYIKNYNNFRDGSGGAPREVGSKSELVSINLRSLQGAFYLGAIFLIVNSVVLLIEIVCGGATKDNQEIGGLDIK